MDNPQDGKLSSLVDFIVPEHDVSADLEVPGGFDFDWIHASSADEEEAEE